MGSEGNVNVRLGVSRIAVLAAGLLAALLISAVVAGSAHATCDTNWTGGVDQSWFTAGNWDHGVPDVSHTACIDNPSTEVDIQGAGAQAQSLELSGGTLKLIGFNDGTSHIAFLALSDGGTIASNASVVLTASCSGPGCSTGAGADLDNNSSTTPITNAGTITTSPGTDNGLNARELNGNFTNTGIIDVGTKTFLDDGSSGRTLDNQGQISIQNAVGAQLTLGPTATGTVINDTGGSITNNGGSGSLSVEGSDAFTQAGGTISPSTANDLHPAVIVDNSLFQTAPTLSYIGTGAGLIKVLGTAKLSGNLASGQNLIIDGDAGCPAETLMTAASGFTNAGTITLTGNCDSGLAITSGGLTNTGTLVIDPTGTNITREIKGGLTNSGTLDLNGATAFDGSGATLAQTAGTTAFGSNVVLDSSGSGATFQLQGGVLTGGGQDQADAAVINGPVNNTGGNVIPGSTTTPGLMTFDGTYSQGPGGKLTAVVDGAGGPSGGTGYSQLGATGDIALSGTLAITTVSNPTVGDLDKILATNGAVSGTFASVTGAFTPGSSFGYRASYGSNYAALSVGATLRVTRSGAGAGSVTSSPGGINCGSTCLALFFGFENVTLTAHPAGGSVFAGWSGACTGSSPTCQVSMTQARTATATFSHPVATTTKLSSSRNPSRVGKRVTYTAMVSPNLHRGTVRFTSGGTTIKGCGAVHVTGAPGRATCSVTYHSKGTRRIRATYSGAGIFSGSSSSTLTETIKKR